MGIAGGVRLFWDTIVLISSCTFLAIVLMHTCIGKCTFFFLPSILDASLLTILKASSCVEGMSADCRLLANQYAFVLRRRADNEHIANVRSCLYEILHQLVESESIDSLRPQVFCGVLVECKHTACFNCFSR